MNLPWLLLFAAIAAPLAACGDAKTDHDSTVSDGEGTGSIDPAASSTSKAAATPLSAPATPSELPKPPLTAEEYAAFLKDEAAPLTPAAFETGLLMLAACEIHPGGIDLTCAELRDYNGAGKHTTTDLRAYRQIGLKHLRHPSPGVRYTAAPWAADEAFSFDRTPENAAKYLDGARSEQHPVVRAKFLSQLTSAARKDTEVRAFALASLDHADSRVRAAALRVVTDRWVHEAGPVAFEKIVSMAESDPDEATRAVACLGLGEMGDPRAVAPIQKLLLDPATPDRVLEGCFEGLVSTWVGAPYAKRPSKEGYDLTMKVLTSMPRTHERRGSSKDNRPLSRGVVLLGGAGSAPDLLNKPGDDWFTKVKGFYDKTKLVKALESIAMDRYSSEATRSDAIDAIKRLGERALLRKLVVRLKKEETSVGVRLAWRAEDH